MIPPTREKGESEHLKPSSIEEYIYLSSWKHLEDSVRKKMGFRVAEAYLSPRPHRRTKDIFIAPADGEIDRKGERRTTLKPTTLRSPAGSVLTVLKPTCCSSASIFPASEKYTSRYGSVLRMMENTIWAPSGRTGDVESRQQQRRL